MISLAAEDKIGGIRDVDKVVSAEISPEGDPLRDIVIPHMVQGPCGALGIQVKPSPCMDEKGVCKKE